MRALDQRASNANAGSGPSEGPKRGPDVTKSPLKASQNGRNRGLDITRAFLFRPEKRVIRCKIAAQSHKVAPSWPSDHREVPLEMSEIQRRTLLLGAACGLAAPLIARPAKAQGLSRTFAGRGVITRGIDATVTRIATAQPYVAMTFDDGPHPRLTPQLLDMLAARGIRATFFVIGRNAARYPQILHRMVAEGHEIGNHTWSHSSLHGHSDVSVLDQVDRTNRAVYAAVGRPPVTMRPPYGNLHDRQRLMLYQARGMPTILWSVDPLDWRRPGSAAVVNRIVGGCHPGAVVLAHDIHSATVRAMPATLDGVAARGYRFLTVSELIGWPRWDRRRLRLVEGAS